MASLSLLHPEEELRLERERERDDSSGFRLHCLASLCRSTGRLQRGRGCEIPPWTHSRRRGRRRLADTDKPEFAEENPRTNGLDSPRWSTDPRQKREARNKRRTSRRARSSSAPASVTILATRSIAQMFPLNSEEARDRPAGRMHSRAGNLCTC